LYWRHWPKARDTVRDYQAWPRSLRRSGNQSGTLYAMLDRLTFDGVIESWGGDRRRTTSPLLRTDVRRHDTARRRVQTSRQSFQYRVTSTSIRGDSHDAQLDRSRNLLRFYPKRTRRTRRRDRRTLQDAPKREFLVLRSATRSVWRCTEYAFVG